MTGDGALLHIDLTADDDSGDRREEEREDGDAVDPLYGAEGEKGAAMSAVLVTQESGERKEEKMYTKEEIDQTSRDQYGGDPPYVPNKIAGAHGGDSGAGAVGEYSGITLNERLRRDGLEPMNESEEFACSVLRAGAGAAAAGVGGGGDDDSVSGVGGVGNAHGGDPREELQECGGVPACVPLKVTEESDAPRNGFSFLSDHNKRQKTLLVCFFSCLFFFVIFGVKQTVYVYYST
jgi:hypothetical protein